MKLTIEQQEVLNQAWKSYTDCKLFDFSNAEMNRQALEKAWMALQKIINE